MKKKSSVITEIQGEKSCVLFNLMYGPNTLENITLKLNKENLKNND
jgi:hypothetical protein